MGAIGEVAHEVWPTSRRSRLGTLGYEINELISHFPPIVAFGEYWLMSGIKLVLE